MGEDHGRPRTQGSPALAGIVGVAGEQDQIRTGGQVTRPHETVRVWTEVLIVVAAVAFLFSVMR